MTTKNLLIGTLLIACILLFSLGDADTEITSEIHIPGSLQGVKVSEGSGYVIPVTELPVIISDDYVAQHGNSFILGGDWSGTSSNGYGVFIIASDVILDGNNHSLTGKRPNSNTYPTGVIVYGSDVEVKNITVKGWYDGICVANTHGGRIEAVTSRENKMGIDLHNASGIEVLNNHADSNTDSGIFLYISSRGNTLTGNTANGNTIVGINIHTGSNDNYLSDNTVNNNLDTGILLFMNSINNTLEGNTASGNANNGLDIWTNDNHIIGNTFSNNHGGIYLDGADNNFISENTVINNRDGGIITAYYSGRPSRFNIIQNNQVSGSVDGGSSQNIGFILYTGSSQNTVQGNTITGNNGGILLHDSTSNTIFDNFIRNSVWNILLEGSTTGNSWNTAKSYGPNIVQGPYLGGNFWATPSGTGFSETCRDDNTDGFCDGAYQIASGHIDLLPLTSYLAPASSDNIGAYQGGQFVLDYNDNFAWDGPETDRIFVWTTTGWTPVVGDWNGEGRAGLGTFNGGTFVLDYNDNFAWDGPETDRIFAWTATGWTPVVGDWDGDGNTGIGTYNNGTFVLDFNDNFAWDGPETDKIFVWTTTGWTPVVGDWNGEGRAGLGTFSGGTFVLDYNDNFAWDGPETDKIFIWTTTGWTPVIGDWNRIT